MTRRKLMTAPKKILVVDDEYKIVEVVKSYLEKEGYTVCEAYNGEDALKQFERHQPSLVVLDIMLPDISGSEICRIIREKSRVPIIMLTARVEEEDILKGFHLGADDYITKPFSPKQLVARVNAVLRRASYDPMPASHTLSFNNDDLIIDNYKLEVRKNHQVINLTPNEYKILITMAKFPSKTFTREELVYKAFGEDYDGYDRTVDAHIKNLRQKIEEDAKHPKYIITVHGVGYRFGGE